MKQELLRRKAVLEAVEQAPPAQIIGEVFGGDTPEAGHPGLEAGVVAVDTLYVPNAIAAVAMVGGNKGARRHAQRLGHGPVGRIAIRTQHRVSAQYRPQRFGQRHRPVPWASIWSNSMEVPRCTATTTVVFSAPVPSWVLPLRFFEGRGIPWRCPL